jgi:glycine/D-amino acid oxidase-like deaminating enzyme/nitrite reductase/ring-hydroxylating ferredoxin subunit
MTTAAVDTSSVWMDTRRPRFTKLNRNTAFDVVVVGGGITGLTAAYLLKNAGKSVVVLEKNRIGEAETGHTTAHLTYVTDLRLKSLVHSFGEDRARMVWRGHAMAVDVIEQIVEEEQIDCRFQRIPGFLHAPLAATKFDADDFEEEANLARRLGFEAQFIPSVPIFNRPGIRFANQGRFQPLDYCADLARAIRGGGSEVFENTEMSDVEDDPLVVTANDHRIECERLIIATHVPLMGLSGLISATLLQTKLYPYSTYALGGTLPKGSVPEADFWDTSDPYYYLRFDPREDGEHFVFGGEDHKTGQESDTESRYEHLEQMLLKFLPQAKVDHRWSGQVIETNDGLPYIGEAASGQFVATGLSGNGLTYGTLAGMMARDWVLARENPWRDLFSLDRTKILGGTWNYLSENVDYPLHLVKGFLSSPEADSVNSVGKGEGKVVKIDGHRCAVSRDSDGKLSVRSAICTHMGCVVRWNGADKTWDCPCHGSRFNHDGEVIGGPAETPLAEVNSEK